MGSLYKSVVTGITLTMFGAGCVVQDRAESYSERSQRYETERSIENKDKKIAQLESQLARQTQDPLPKSDFFPIDHQWMGYEIKKGDGMHRIISRYFNEQLGRDLRQGDTLDQMMYNESFWLSMWKNDFGLQTPLNQGDTIYVLPPFSQSEHEKERKMWEDGLMRVNGPIRDIQMLIEKPFLFHVWILTAQRGDNFDKIAKELNTSVEDLHNENPYYKKHWEANGRKIYPGQKFRHEECMGRPEIYPGHFLGDPILM